MTTADEQQDVQQETQQQTDASSLNSVERLKKDFAARKAAQRPMSHSLAVAYQKVIAQCAQNVHSDPTVRHN